MCECACSVVYVHACVRVGVHVCLIMRVRMHFMCM